MVQRRRLVEWISSKYRDPVSIVILRRGAEVNASAAVDHYALALKPTGPPEPGYAAISEAEKTYQPPKIMTEEEYKKRDKKRRQLPHSEEEK